MSSIGIIPKFKSEEEKTRQKVRPVYLRPWEELVGLLEDVSVDEGVAILEISREVKIKLPPEKLAELEDVVGEEVRVLRTDGFKIDEFLVDIREETDDG
ncbi:hypothetical protein AKJ48_00495 [candidate division MSBL1 archaeon SCGC-AAA261O19]|uniref:Uncharacterized protein n=2 Tax=candidate division MSBL1 TaxID=215777 RepID=A0A133V116_9EURY|nr:hypothetical protein AKJ42_01600 [candidate division MSBL1 archaeon SCGC-AAA261C02]KXB05031.1 hypothetical protein AKJ48_00495 [candidate division MSBL1 archaeon SCGC-AAA261O19]